MEESEISFHTNSAPFLLDVEVGGCFVTPMEGYAVTTEFVISCQGWEDDDMPLKYEFRYVLTFLAWPRCGKGNHVQNSRPSEI